MIYSFFLSAFFFIFLLIAIEAYDLADFSFLSMGAALNLPLRKAVSIAVAVIIICAGTTWIILAHGGPGILGDFYIALFTISFFLSAILILPKSRTGFLSSILITAALLLAILIWKSQLLQDFYMAFALIWTGPFLFKKLSAKRSYLFVLLIAFLAFDVFNIYFSHPVRAAFSDASLLLNGDIVIGGWLLGIADFFFAYIAVNAVQKDISKRSAIVLALVISYARFVIRALTPAYYGDIPYSLVIVPGTFIAYAVHAWQSKKRSLSPGKIRRT